MSQAPRSEWARSLRFTPLGARYAYALRVRTQSIGPCSVEHCDIPAITRFRAVNRVGPNLTTPGSVRLCPDHRYVAVILAGWRNQIVEEWPYYAQ